MLISLFASVSKYLCVVMASCDIQKYFMLIQDYQLKPEITVPDKTHAVFSHCLHSISLSPFHNISLSLSVFSAYVSPGLIPHIKRMMFYYDYHCLIDNKCLRMHKLFHLSLRYNIYCIYSCFGLCQSFWGAWCICLFSCKTIFHCLVK